MNLYVGNLDFEITEEEIKILFEQVGDVAHVKLMRDKESGRSKGFAFVQMDDTEEAVIALKTLNGREFHGRNIVVNQGTDDGDGKKSSSGFKKPFDRDRKPYADGFKKPYDKDRKPFSGERKPYSSDRKPFTGDRKPYDRGQGNFERKPYDANQPRRSYDNESRPQDFDQQSRKPVGEPSRRPRISERPDDRKHQHRDDHSGKRFNDED